MFISAVLVAVTIFFFALRALFQQAAFIQQKVAIGRFKKRAMLLKTHGAHEVSVRSRREARDVVLTLDLLPSTKSLHYTYREFLNLDPYADALSFSLAKLKSLGGVTLVSCQGQKLKVEFTLLHKDLHLIESYLESAKEIAAELNQSSEHIACACCKSAMRQERGMIDEYACEKCGGRFVPQASAERFMLERFHIGISSLKKALKKGQKSNPCPGCKTRMGRVQLNAVVIELCEGCGGMWFDKGELTQLSEGEVREL